MNDRITAGAAAIMAGLTVGTATVRWYFTPVGQPQAPRVTAVLNESSLDELMGPWIPSVPFGAAVRSGWQDCPTCEQTTAGVVCDDGWWCGECRTPVPAGGAW